MIFRCITEREDLLCEPEELARIMTAWKQEVPVRIKTGMLSTKYLIMVVPAPKEKGPLTDFFASLAPETAPAAPKEKNETSERADRPERKEKRAFDPWKRAAVHN